MFEVGKHYKAASGYVCVVLYVGEKVALVRVTEADESTGKVGAEFTVSKDLRGYTEYTPPKVYTKTVTISAWPAGDGRGDELLIHNGDVDINYGQKLGVINITYTEGGRLLTRVEQE